MKRLLLLLGVLIVADAQAPRPQDDFYAFANQAWLATTAMPAERVQHTAFTEIIDRTETDLQTIIEGLIAAKPAPGTGARQIVDLYLSVADPKYADALGAAPLRAELGRIDAAASMRDIAAAAGRLSNLAAGGPFDGSVAVDARNPSRLIFRLSQGGNLLPSREYYLSDAAPFVEMRRKYAAYLERIFTLTNRARPADDARLTIEIETALARAEWTPGANSPEPAGRPFSLTRMNVEFPGFDWQAWARPQGIDLVEEIFVLHPSFFAGVSALTRTMPLDGWKAWLAARHITAQAPYLSTAFVQARFDFFGRDLTGQESPRPLWKRGVSLVSLYLGDAIGRLYAEKYFPAGADRRVRAIVEAMVAAFKDAIRDSAWMSDAAKNEAVGKLSNLTVKIGAPGRWRDYTGYVVAVDDLLGNISRGKAFDNAYRMKRVNAPLDRREWTTTPQTANAYYNPALNEIVLPAAILQAPLYDAGGDDAANFGALGAIIGHELAHGLDDRGRFVDGRGNSRDWWKPQDIEGFAVRASPLFAQAPKTFREDLGDVIGLSIAHRAYRLARKGAPGDDRAFFLAYARMWRTKIRDEYERHQLLSSDHAAGSRRANGPAANLDAFYAAFDVKPGDGMFVAPEKRIRIW